MQIRNLRENICPTFTIRDFLKKKRDDTIMNTDHRQHVSTLIIGDVRVDGVVFACALRHPTCRYFGRPPRKDVNRERTGDTMTKVGHLLHPSVQRQNNTTRRGEQLKKRPSPRISEEENKSPHEQLQIPCMCRYIGQWHSLMTPGRKIKQHI